MNRFFVDFDGREFDKSIDITGEDVNHIKNVLRLKVNDEIIISDGRGRDYRCQISVMDHEKVVADILDVNVSVAKKGLKEFHGTDRRFEYKGEVNGFTIIDDYAHHPT